MGLLQATQFVKDNRLLPRGFDKSTASRENAVIGEALADADFQGEGDRVRYDVDVVGGRGPATVEVELLFQTISYRWAQNLGRYYAPEPRRSSRTSTRWLRHQR